MARLERLRHGSPHTAEGRPPPPPPPADPRHWEGFQVAGDVVLTVGSGVMGLGNQLVQSAYERRWSRVTHAMLVAVPGLYFDVSPTSGALFRRAERFPLWLGAAGVRAGSGRRFVAAFRHPLFAARPELRERLLAALVALEGVPYNFEFFLKRRVGDPSAFCSELVVRALARVGLPVLPGRREASVLPHTLDLVLRRGPWLDVSADYRARLARPAPEARAAGRPPLAAPAAMCAAA